jgi:hypothetical protein
MNTYKYRIIPEVALDFYRENGMILTFNESLMDGELIITAPDEETADSIRKTFTDIRMWEKI